jgi:23S rRNA pseudouridine1911/1915/1917 synthase
VPISTFKVDKDHEHTRLDVYLTQTLTDVPSRTFVQKLIEFGYVRVNEMVVKTHHKVKAGDDITVEIPEDFLAPQHIKPEKIPLDIFYEDDQLIVINKPPGMIVHPAQGCYTGTLVNALLHYSVQLSQVNTDMRPGIVHRLDRGTSGLILIAKDNITHTKIAKQFQRHEIKKKYVALVKGEIAFDEGVVNAPIGRHPHHREKKAIQFDEEAKEAFTRYRVIQRSRGCTLVSLFPKTGRTHQLRVHLSYIGHPILGDDKYGNKNSFPRLALHAQGIALRHPQSKRYLEFVTKTPHEFLEFLVS